ncbi:sigma-54-dependent Fis family transcriptional regulator [Desulfovermiculus halophilus]|uniref:sigma-54-dependent Fis family transcriptional regulator n=1 Tax=Desulfovermiculus halophilus TaxID=339722 RepID=UPI0006847822|nr:sigma-54-dependent Fis family transcriptional regulator [Desulfovermiculus halophilus]
MHSDLTNDAGQRIVMLAYPGYSHFIKDKLSAVQHKHLQFVECVFEQTISQVTELLSQDLVDVFITGGSNARLFRKHFPDQPLVTMGINEFDILWSLIQASKLGDSATIITYEENIKELDNLNKILNIQLTQRTFVDEQSLLSVLHDLRASGEKTIIGSSIVCDYGRKQGFQTIFIYSRKSVQKSVDTAIEMQRSIHSEKKKSQLLNTIINYAYSGIISIDEKGCVQVFNQGAEKLMNIRKKDIMHKYIHDVIPNTKLIEVVQTKKKQINELQKIDNESTILTSRVPIIVNERCIGAVATFHDIHEVQNAEHQIRKAQATKDLKAKYTLDDIWGQSQSIENAKQLATIYARSNETVLLYGQTGTGKELFAQSIHNYSERKTYPFVALNCAALPETLLESELFGYEKGAFTGASREGKIGLIELSHTGTLFLDEISEIPMRLQIYLLRFLQEKEIVRIGGRKTIPINTRIIAASNKNLWHEVQQGKFRSDLYYRLNILYLKLPSLNERKEDIPDLVRNFVKGFQEDLFNKHSNLWTELIDTFFEYNWRGNIRELENVIMRYCIILNNTNWSTNQPCLNDINQLGFYDSMMNIEEILENKFLSKKYFMHDSENIYLDPESENRTSGAKPESFSTTASGQNMDCNAYSRKHNTKERDQIINTLYECSGNRKFAAQKLGYSRSTLWRKMKKYGLN